MTTFNNFHKHVEKHIHLKNSADATWFVLSFCY